jgi:flagellar basal-body rod protein FlgB
MSLTSQRASLLTKNLANVNVPDYKRQDIDFAITPEGENPKSGESLRNLQQKFGSDAPGASSSIRIDGNSVDLETEVMSISEMEIRYQLIAEMTSRHFSGLKSVIREGR